MSNLIVHDSEPLTLVGGAVVSQTVLNICLKLAPTIVAADGGANHVWALENRPKAVIGDLDSLSQESRIAFADVLHSVTEQDTTDFEKAICRIDAPLILAAGFLGGRLDHTLAVLNVLYRFADKAVICLSEEDVVFLVSERTKLRLNPGQRLAILPLASVEVTTRGLVWDMNRSRLHPTGLVSSSNEVAEPEVDIEASGPVFVTLPLAGLDAAITAVRA